MKRSEKHGREYLKAEVTNVSMHGLWILYKDKELFLAYDEFPWFRDAPLKSVFKIEVPYPGHFYWPDLDVDLSVEIIENPERFPLKARPDKSEKKAA